MNQSNKISNGMRDRLFEITLFTVGIVGLFVLFTLMFAGPRFIYQKIIEYFGF